MSKRQLTEDDIFDLAIAHTDLVREMRRIMAEVQYDGDDDWYTDPANLVINTNLTRAEDALREFETYLTNIVKRNEK